MDEGRRRVTKSSREAAAGCQLFNQAAHNLWPGRGHSCVQGLPILEGLQQPVILLQLDPLLLADLEVIGSSQLTLAADEVSVACCRQLRLVPLLLQWLPA